MIAEIITIGDELLVGQVVNTNASWMAQQLNLAGIGVSRIVTIQDAEDEIISALDEALSRADIILMTGGLGPTNDDITKHTLCEYFNTRLILHEPTYRNIKTFFTLHGYTLTERNRQQAELPESCIPIPNDSGTAPGMMFEKDGSTIISMPGVPFEMKSIMEKSVIPLLVKKGNNHFKVHRTVITHGVGESFLAEKINDWEHMLPENIKLAYLPSPGIVRLRLSGTGEDRVLVTKMIESKVIELQRMIPDFIFGYDNDTMEGVVGELLKEKGQTVCTAESCTGGYLSHLITSVPGSSGYYLGSVIAYSNQVKERMLGVKLKTLEKYGAVSEETVIEMAQGARKKFGTTFALSVSGIAGPDGGSEQKPVGTVWIALAYPGGTSTKKFLFGEHRDRNIRRSALAALNMLRLRLLI